MKIRYILAILMMFSSCWAVAEDVSDLRLMAISVQDQKAVVTTKGGKMLTLSKGDVLADFDVTVDAIMADKLILHDNQSNDDIWLSVAPLGGKSVVTRLSKRVPFQEKPMPIYYTDKNGKLMGK